MDSLPEDAGGGPAAVLSRFRREFHACLAARADELTELADAVLCADWLRGSLLAPPAGERWLHPHEGDSCWVSFGPTARGLGRRWPGPTAGGLCQSAGQLAARATALTLTTAGT